MNRNAFMLTNKLAYQGYDWWWHSLVGISKNSGNLQPFFIQYFVINPGLGEDKPILGQLEKNQSQGILPSYAMLRAGTWKEKAVQINNFYSINNFYASPTKMDVQIGQNLATETRIKGKVKLSKKQAANSPEFMSDFGEMSWNLSVQKVLSYDVGIGASLPMRLLNAFEMYWHVAGKKTLYKGKIVYNDEEFEVIPDYSYGYQDKNWGSDFTNPWVWLNCNNFISKSSNKKLNLTSLVVGGECPVLFGKPLPKKLLVAFHHEGKLYDFNWSKIWEKPEQKFVCEINNQLGKWNIEAWNNKAKIKINFTCSVEKMLQINYENPIGQKNHQRLFNGSHASGTIELYDRINKNFELVDIFYGKLGGCEYGFY